MAGANSSIYYDRYYFETRQNGFFFFNIVGGYPSNFGIDELYIGRGNLDQQCLVGLSRIYAYQNKNRFFADMTVNPIGKNYGVGAWWYDSKFYYTFICVL